jgi:hypothetical protein
MAWLILDSSMALVTDADFFLDPLDPKLFPGIDPKIEVHNGFAEEHALWVQLEGTTSIPLIPTFIERRRKSYQPCRPV